VSAQVAAHSVAPASPTSDRGRARADLARAGYCIVEGALPEARCRALLADLQRLSGEEVASDTDYVYDGGSNQRVWNLLRKGALYRELVQDPLGMELMTEMLGGDFLLSNAAANITGPGGKPMVLHSDQSYVPPPWPPYALVANVMWMLSDFTEANGATRVVPGSHLLGHGPPMLAAQSIETVAASAPAGSALIFDGRLWHQTGANVTAADRRYGILIYYCRAFMRQQENWFRSLPGEVFQDASPLLRRLLGMNNYLTLGMVDGLPREWTRY
jgi:ectoine hydroxylase-related dioxygenase (phytanoyl-CoA dioxygenase family)